MTPSWYVARQERCSNRVTTKEENKFMSAGTSITKTAETHIRGAVLQTWSCTIATTALTAAGQQIDPVAIPGVLANDQVFVNAGSSLAGLQIQGAKVTASDVVSIYSVNNWLTALATSTQALDLLIIKRGKGNDLTSA